LARASLGVEVAMRSLNAPENQPQRPSIRVRPPYIFGIQIARCRCRVISINMYGMNQAYNAGGGDPSAQVPNHLVSAPAAVQGSLDHS
jgi:hypothetical protein